MSPSSYFLFVILSTPVIISATYGASVIVGGWQKIDDLKAPEVVKIAKFAVAEHNRLAKTRLNFSRVLEGERQVVSGIKYRLVLAAGGPNNYTAVVWYKAWLNKMQLISFDKTPPSTMN